MGKSGTSNDFSNFPCLLKKVRLPFLSQTQTSSAFASKYKSFFVSISSKVLLPDLISTQISGATEATSSSSIMFNRSSETQTTSATLTLSEVAIAHSGKANPVSSNELEAQINEELLAQTKMVDCVQWLG